MARVIGRNGRVGSIQRGERLEDFIGFLRIHVTAYNVISGQNFVRLALQL